MTSTVILSDNGASSGSAGLKSTAGNDGVLILQTTTSGGTAANAIVANNLQNVAVGGASPLPSRALTVGDSSNALLALVSSGVNRLDFGTVANYDYGRIQYNSTGDIFTFFTAQTARVNLNQYGIGLGNTTPSSGTGITFPASQSASSDANTLDDYEEGTWTPTISNWSGTYATQQGFYTKVGRQVTVYGRVSTTGGSGSWTANQFPNLSNLPFASQSVASTAVQGVWGFSSGVTGLASPNIGAGTFDGPQNGGTSAFPNMFRVGDNIGNFPTNNLSNSVNCEMRFQLTYFTA